MSGTNEACVQARPHPLPEGQLDDALQALHGFKGTVPEEIKGDLEFLQANVYMATGQPGRGCKCSAS